MGKADGSAERAAEKWALRADGVRDEVGGVETPPLRGPDMVGTVEPCADEKLRFVCFLRE
jgi:hypothetical protein